MISRKFEARVKKAAGETLDEPVDIELTYDEENDPLSVQMIITEKRSSEDVVWTVGRDLVAQGVNSYTVVGGGDVKFRYLGVVYGTLMVCLKNNSGHADIAFPHAEVAEFLEATFTVVPQGQEYVDDHIDELIREILA